MTLLATTAWAAPKGKTLQEAEWWAADAKVVVKKAAAVNKACGTKINASYDDKSYENIGYEEARHASYCQQSLDALAFVCRTELGKEAVKTKVQSAVCRYSTTGTRVELKNGALIVHIDPKKTSIEGDKKGSYSWISAIKERL